MGADFVLNTKVADDLALIESRNEFVERFQSEMLDKTNKNLPMLASSCPGWVCYAEKTHGNFIIPYISTTRSAQVIIIEMTIDQLSLKALSLIVFTATNGRDGQGILEQKIGCRFESNVPRHRDALL